MESFNREESRSTPKIHFDGSTGELKIHGESYPENSYEFYKPVLEWISRFLAQSDGPVTLKCSVSYLNTGSTKSMIDILDLLEEAHLAGRDASVEWYCDPENDRALETAEEFKEEVSLPFQILDAGEE